MLIVIIEICYERGIKKILRCEHKKACGCSVVEGKLSDQTTKARICKVRLAISQRVIEFVEFELQGGADICLTSKSCCVEFEITNLGWTSLTLALRNLNKRDDVPTVPTLFPDTSPTK